jgi:hypothetical protein
LARGLCVYQSFCCFVLAAANESSSCRTKSLFRSLYHMTRFYHPLLASSSREVRYGRRVGKRRAQFTFSTGYCPVWSSDSYTWSTKESLSFIIVAVGAAADPTVLASPAPERRSGRIPVRHDIYLETLVASRPCIPKSRMEHDDGPVVLRRRR